MKSKIQTNQILLKKGMSILLLIVMLLSVFSATLVSFAAEEDHEEDFENIDGSIADSASLDSPSTEEVVESLKSDIEELQNKLNSLIENKDEYTEFRSKLEDSTIKIIEISNELQLRILSLFVAEGNNCSGRTFVITNNIELTSSIEWDPIGSTTNVFKGTIDGRGYTISGMSITRKQSYAGLIGYANGAIVKNLTIDNSNIDIKPNIEDTINDLTSTTGVKYVSAGSFAGGAKNSTFINCINKSDITAGSNVGGIVGYIADNSIIENCINEGDIKGYSRVGGIVGCAVQLSKDTTQTLKINRNINKGKVFGTSIDVGGIVGNLRYNSIVTRCQNSGTVATSTEKINIMVLGKVVTINPQNVGGIVGAVGGNGSYYDGTNNKVTTIIEYCINEESANVYGYQDIGGLIGQLGNSSLGYSRLNNSINYSSNVKATETNYVGGIAGAVGGSTNTSYQTGRIYNCYYMTNLTKEKYEAAEINTLAIRKTQQTKSVIEKGAGNIGSFGNLYGSDGGSSNPNMSFKIIKDSNKYYYETRVHYVNDSGKVKVKNRTLYTPSKFVDGKGVYWIRTEEVVEEGKSYYPQAGSEFLPHIKSLEPVNTEEKKEELRSYQHWLYCLTTEGRLVSNSNNKIVIDITKPVVETVTLSTDTGSAIAVPGDTMVFKVEFSENISKYAGKPTLQFDFKYYDNASNSNKTSTKFAKFVGVDENKAIFEYVVTELDAGDATDKTENRIVRNVKISENLFKDIFNNKNQEKVLSSVEDDDFIVLKNDSYKSKTYTSSVSKETIGASIAYRFYDSAEEIGFSGTSAYIKDKFNLRVHLNKKITTAFDDNINLKLNIKLENGETISHNYTNEKNGGTDSIQISDSSNYSYIYFRNIVSEGETGKVEEVYLTVDSDLILKGKEEDVVKFTYDNTKAEVDYIYLDNIAPMIEKKISSKSNYAIGDKIVLGLTISDNYALEEITTSNLPVLKIKFGTGEFKNVNPSTIVNTEDGKLAEVLYEYTIQESDNGLLVIEGASEVTIKDIAGNATKISTTDFKLQTDKYADTSTPIVNIIPSDSENGVTNANEITYTFDWSEEVIDFTVEDITINGGKVKVGETLTQDTTDKTKYTLVIVPEVSQGNEGEVQVIVEAGTCKDIVSLSNIRSENKVKVDRKAPTLTDYSFDKSEDGTQIVIKTIFDEAIGLADTSDIEIKFGQNLANGQVSSATINANDNRIVTYIYNISGADEGNPTITLKASTVKDIVGNSNSVDFTLKNDIALQKSVIIVDGVEYSFSKNGVSIINFANPTYFKLGDTITVTKHVIAESSTSGYIHIIDENCDLTHMIYMNLMDSNEVTFSNKNGNIDISAANIYFDTMYPTIKTEVYAEEKTPSGIYKENDKIIIKVTSSEEILEENDLPTIQVNFSNSGKGKYSYESENKTGFAKFEKKEINQNGSTTIYYEYIIKEGDEGEISISFESGEISDLAGNVTNIKELYIPKEPAKEYSEINEFGVNIKTVEFFTNSNCTQAINPIEGTKQTGDIYVKVTLEDGLYTDINTSINTTNAPIMKLNGEIETEIINVSENGSVIVYKYIKEACLNLTSIDYITLINKNDTKMYPGKDAINSGKAIITDATYNYDTPDFEVDPRDIENSITIENIIADTLAPTVAIIAANGDAVITNSVTNAEEITYTFDWSEEVTGFEVEDITVNGGNVKTGTTLTQDSTDKTKYTLVVTTNVSEGNQGNIQIIVEQNACQDIAGHKNVRTESIIAIDKQSPILIGLEASANSTITLNSNVDTVKEYYKAGDLVTIVAVFNETIEGTTNMPVLNLQFSESGNAKGTVREGSKAGNKITYTYTVTSEDTGTLSVKGFSGTVIDAAGNETKVTKRILDGDVIIADTKVPKLNELKVVSPSDGTYKSGNTIVIEAIYDEEIYSLINNEINNFTPENVPTLKLKFGNGGEKEATSTGYVSDEDKTKLVYTYTIVEGDNGDNGELIITSYNNKENVKVTDIAGNEAVLGVKQSGNTITADTISPEVTNIAARIENPSILNTGIYHKAENKITITLTFSEKVSSAKLMPEILIGFSEDANVEPKEYNIYAYESDWNANSTTVEYTYTIKDGDNGYLWVKVPEKQFKDVAGNENIEEGATKISNVFADTTAPTITMMRDEVAEQNKQTIIIRAEFSEVVYDLNGNSRETLTKENAPKVLYSIGNARKEVAASEIDGAIIEYTITKQVGEDGTLLYSSPMGNLYDRAGNEYYIETTDTTAPVLESIEIIPDAGKYSEYCKAGTDIYVIATFNEQIENENIKLKAIIGENESTNLLDGIVLEDNTKVKFTYQVKAGDMGEFKIVDVCGDTDDTITEENADNTYGWVEDKHGNKNKIYNLSDEGVTIVGEAEADTKDPYITSIKALADEKEVATYTKEEGKDVVVTVGRTKANIVEYVVTYNEKVPYNQFDRISITNGEIKSVEYTNSAMNEYKITVQTTVEGVQSLIINEGTVEDKAGNIDGLIRLDAVTVDFTKPTVRFISEYNGGVYVLPKNIDKVEIRPNVEISEDITNIEYKWDNGEYTQINNYSSSSDIAIPTKAFDEVGTYVLSIRVQDLAGNVEETSKTYEIVNSNIDITLSTEEYTNQDLTATVIFRDGLTDNKKVTFKAEGSNEIVELNAIGTTENGTTYLIATNGIIYAEATDKVGNKVFTEEEVLNIDKNAPEITFSEIPSNLLKGEPLDISIYTNEYVLISYSWDNENWVEPQKYLTTFDITKSFEEVGEYTLYVKAKDKAGNESTNQLNLNVTNLDFEVLGNIKDWTTQDVDLYVEYEGELAAITVNGTAIDAEKRVYVAKENGEYVFVITDKYGNTATKTEKVEKIDKVAPVISKVENEGKDITISAIDELSGVKEYAITSTTELPVEWSESNLIKTTEDGIFYVWIMDKAGNITRTEDVVVVDTTAPEITFNYSLLTVLAGMPIETTIVTDEEAIISYSWDEKTWIDSEEFITNVRVAKKYDMTGKYTLYAKAIDQSGNESKVQAIEFTVVKPEEILDPQVVFEGLPTIKIDGVHYVKVSDNMTIEDITNKMDKKALCGLTPEYINLAEGNNLKTGSEIVLNGDTKYIVVVNGDVNCDGDIDFLGDIILANDYRIGIGTLSTIQKLAADINNDGKVDFISDILAINDYRIGITKSL